MSVGVSAEMLSGADFRRMIAGAYGAFLQDHEYINSLNVYPVPDGDTGTNMLLTLGAVHRALDETTAVGIGQLSRLAADSAIMGARGNSGVIMAQLFRGVARGLAGKEAANCSEVSKAFQYGILYAYRAVARPVEGTILTVAKGMARGARRAVRDRLSFADVLMTAVKAGKAELELTPELLPALKAAGVVDAGGQGLITLLAGCLEGLEGRYGGPEADFSRTLVVAGGIADALTLTHPYCTEFVVKQCAVDADGARRQLEQMGDSLVLAAAEAVLKVHIHTAHPGAVLEKALSWGTLHDVKIDNMADQHRQTSSLAEKPAELAVISVAPGPGLAAMMRNLGAEHIINGGPTMNPAVEEFVDVVHGGEARRYIILPNNGNVIMAALQARKLLGGKAEVVATRSAVEGLAALMAFAPEAGVDANLKRMAERASGSRTAGITAAVRDSVLQGQAVAAGEYIGVIDDELVSAGTNLAAVLAETVKALAATGAEVITLYYGGGLTEQAAHELKSAVAEAFPDIEVELYYGGQPLYHFIIGVE
jgi:hypothetical protein